MVKRVIECFLLGTVAFFVPLLLFSGVVNIIKGEDFLHGIIKIFNWDQLFFFYALTMGLVICFVALGKKDKE
ncbi:MAG: hypothetical protein GWP10_20225 [Nitrospiraceae bacterium]|nr:hypothetical protein [Nitrospiraceae bacterium]